MSAQANGIFFGFLNNESFATVNSETRNRVEIPIPNRHVFYAYGSQKCKERIRKTPFKNSQSSKIRDSKRTVILTKVDV